MEEKHHLIYDRECTLCHRFKRPSKELILISCTSFIPCKKILPTRGSPNLSERNVKGMFTLLLLMGKNSLAKKSSVFLWKRHQESKSLLGFSTITWGKKPSQSSTKPRKNSEKNCEAVVQAVDNKHG